MILEKMMKSEILFSGIAVLAVAAQASAAFTPGNPYGNITNSGIRTTNSLTGLTGYGDQWTGGSAFIGPLPSAALDYKQTGSPNTIDLGIKTVFLDTITRDAGGVIRTASTPGGLYTNTFGSFNIATGNRFGRVDRTGSGPINGIQVEVNSTASNHYQLGELELLTIQPSANVAFGQTSIASPGSQAGNMTDEFYNGIGVTEWRASSSAATNGGEQWTGFEFAGQQSTELKAIRIVTSAPHGLTFVWRDFDIQLKQGGVWVTQGRANVPATQDIYWATFPDYTFAEGVRLFGSTAGGNNPTASGGLIVDDIFAFVPLPEPSSAILLVGAALGMIRRRRA